MSAGDDPLDVADREAIARYEHDLLEAEAKVATLKSWLNAANKRIASRRAAAQQAIIDEANRKRQADIELLASQRAANDRREKIEQQQKKVATLREDLESRRESLPEQLLGQFVTELRDAEDKLISLETAHAAASQPVTAEGVS